jgi:hypothetical protein
MENSIPSLECAGTRISHNDLLLPAIAEGNSSGFIKIRFRGAAFEVLEKVYILIISSCSLAQWFLMIRIMFSWKAAIKS